MKKETYFAIVVNTAGLALVLSVGNWINPTNGMLSAGLAYIVTMLTIGKFENSK